MKKKQKKILIVSALKTELSRFLKLTRAVPVTDHKTRFFYRGFFVDAEVTLAHLGVGLSFCKNLHWLGEASYDAALLVGICGGLQHGIKAGDTAFPENIFTMQTRIPGKIDHPNETLLLKLFTIRPAGNMCCSTEVITQNNRDAFKQKIEYVDMESYYFSQYCRQKKTQFLVVKAVSDTISTRFPKPKFIQKSITGLKIWPTVKHFVLNPLDIILMYILYFDIKKALKNNLITVKTILQEIL